MGTSWYALKPRAGYALFMALQQRAEGQSTAASKPDQQLISIHCLDRCHGGFCIDDLEKADPLR